MVYRAPVELSNRRFWLLIVGATAAIMLGCWLCSGTLAPYGTNDYGPCHYRVNVDHPHFRAVYDMLDGRPSADWDYSVVLRRILHPLLAFPLMKAFGFDLGGILFNVLSHGAALVCLALAIRRYFDAHAAVLVSWLLASYPGYAYWAGVPYSYAFIVPGSIACAIALLWWNDRPALGRSAITACVVGLVGCGYDLMPFFGGALLLMILLQRRWVDLVVAIVVLALWALFIARGLPAIFGFSASNTNTAIYGAIVDSYLHTPQHLDGWGSLMLDVPHVFVSNFLFSGMIFFPLLLVWSIALHLRWRIRPVIGRVALCILLSTLAVFLFLNLAPPYHDAWPLRGTWIARLYQPWFVVVLVVVAGTSVVLRRTQRYRLWFWSVVLVAMLDALAIVGPYVRFNTLYVIANQNFYQHPMHHKNSTWLRRLGVRPYGFCK